MDPHVTPLTSPSQFIKSDGERAHGHIQNLTGRQASIAQLQQIVYMTSRFSDQILKVMNVSGYHAGDNILVEIDVGMPLSTYKYTSFIVSDGSLIW